jgi:release factor glutamine methyltransferase
VFAEDEARLLVESAHSPAELADLTARRVSGLPLEHVLGWAEFCGLQVRVEPGVFVPRRRSEFLVSTATDLVRARRRRLVVVDMCCGSGALGLAVSRALGDVELHASDLDAAAVSCARRNLAGIGAVHAGDLFEALPGRLLGRLDVLVANVPYVPTDAIGLLPPEARDYEPRVALDGGPDGQVVMRRVIADAPRWLRPGGYVLIESSQDQVSPALARIASAGLIASAVTSEDHDTAVVVGRRADVAPGPVIDPTAGSSAAR